MAKTKFEAAFRAFVEGFGGEIVPEEAERSADYFFPQHNIVAELKCLVVDQTADTFRKWGEIIDQRRAAPPPEPGPDDILLPCTRDGEKFTILFDESFRQAWGKVLLAPIENLIRDAKQL